MKSNNLVLDLAYQQLGEVPPQVALIILHPLAGSLHSRLVLRAIQSASQSCLVPCVADINTVDLFVNQLLETLQQEANLAIDLSGAATLPEVAATISHAINSLGDFRLILENYDALSDEGIHELILQMVQHLTPSHQIIISSRTVHPDLMNWNGHVTMIPHLPNNLFVNYLEPNHDKIRLEVHGLGPSQAIMNGRIIETWDGLLPKCLFYFLVDHGMTTRSIIFDTFWPALKQAEATNVFHVTKRKVNEMLGDDLMTYAKGYYRIADNINLTYDVILFRDAVQQAEIAEDETEAQTLYEQALRLYRGHFLSDLDQDWIVERREELQHEYSDALMGLGNIYWRRGVLAQAEGLLYRSFSNVPYRENIAQNLLQFYQTQGRGDDRQAVYHRLAVEMDRRFGVKPAFSLSD